MADDSAGGPAEATPGPAATIEDYFSEDRVFPASESFRHDAVLSDPGIYERAEVDWTGFWAEQAGSLARSCDVTGPGRSGPSPGPRR